MKLSEARDVYYYNSGKLSDVARQLAFAGIAVIWIFKTQSNTVPHQLVLPIAYLMGALAFDLLQYVYAATAWGWFQRRKELADKRIKTQLKPEFEAPRAINWPTLGFFGLKVLSLLIGYALLFEFLFEKLS